MSRPEVSGMFVKWPIELGEFSTEFKARRALKAQVLVDFIQENGPWSEGRETYILNIEKSDQWEVQVDGSSMSGNGGIGVCILGHGGDNHDFAVKLTSE
ncbi:UNVERIFIED_CONTAM: hypothetical protein Slati_1319600 [Sesamum latifolium]|uniref:Uncharacterized protein n=1 Tax=Sesamum latifolium TaxID=2727402 RepID=A0AAW2XGX7_9LAMI